MIETEHSVYLLLGSNLSDRIATLKAATALLAAQVGEIKTVSKYYETQAWGKTNQPDFINQALEVRTKLTPHAVLSGILQIEKDLGRTRTEKWAERTIDIDILLYDNQVINLPDLIIPHPHLHERNFALIPLMEIAGEIEHPLLHKTIEDIYFDCIDPLEVILMDEK